MKTEDVCVCQCECVCVCIINVGLKLLRCYSETGVVSCQVRVDGDAEFELSDVRGYGC